MTDQIVKSLYDPAFLIAVLVSLAVFATIFTVLPAFGANPLKARMKSVALERDELRAKQRARLAAESDRRRKGLREEQSLGMKSIVERLDLRRALVDEGTLNKLRMAGFRGQNPLTRFLFFRLVLPFVGFALAALYVFVLGGLPDQPPLHQAVRLHRRRLCRLLRAGPLRLQPRARSASIPSRGHGRTRST